MDEVEESSRLAFAFVEAFNRHDGAAIGSLLSLDCVFESAGPPPLGIRYEGRSAVTRAVGEFFESNPALQMAVEEVYGAGNRSVLRWKLTGIVSFQPGRRGVDLFTVNNGRIVEILAYAKG